VKWLRVGLLATSLAGLGACASDPVPEMQAYDPWEGFNRASYRAMDVADRVALQPLARGYASVFPAPVETGIANFFQNLRTPLSALCGFLQGKFDRGGKDLGRFLLNSTVGLAGLIDVAGRAGIEFQDEDLGQVFATWGYRRSRVLYLPIVGPTTVRDLPGDVLNRFLSPRWLLGDAYGWPVATLDSLSLRSSALTATDARDAAALDPYAFTREGNHQRRLDKLYDGDPPVEDFLDEALDESDDDAQ